MTVSEVMNCSPTVDARIVAPEPVCDENLQMVVERAKNQLRQFTLQRQEIDRRIAVIKRTIHCLDLLCGEELQRGPEKAAIGGRRRGITKACRAVLNRADTPLTTRGVYFILQEEFSDLVRQPGDYYASLVTILNRLAKYGEVETFLRNGSRFWQRQQSTGHRSEELSSV